MLPAPFTSLCYRFPEHSITLCLVQPSYNPTDPLADVSTKLQDSVFI